MGIFNKLRHDKESKKRGTPAEKQEQYEEICKRIDDCEKIMARCVIRSKDLDPSSSNFRDYKRIFNKVKSHRSKLKECKEILRRMQDIDILHADIEAEMHRALVAAKEEGSYDIQDAKLEENQRKLEALLAALKEAHSKDAKKDAPDAASDAEALEFEDLITALKEAYSKDAKKDAPDAASDAETSKK